MPFLKGAFASLSDFAGDKASDLKDFIFGVNIVEDPTELASLRSTGSGSRKSSFINSKSSRHNSMDPSRKTLIPDDLQSENLEEYGEYDCSRNLVVSSTTLFRKGPVPIEHLSHQEQNRLSKRGCILEWNDAQRSTSDNHLAYIDPSSKSLLTYFAR